MDLPPLYEANSTEAPTLDYSELPAYRRRSPTLRPLTAPSSPRTEHVFELSNKKKGTWAKLKLLSGARSPKQLPIYFEGENITGTIELDLTIPDAIHCIYVLVSRVSVLLSRFQVITHLYIQQVKGQVLTGADVWERSKFLRQSQTIWSRDATAAPFPGGKLRGKHSLPFSLTLPRDVDLPVGSNQVSEKFRLPHSFLEKLTRASVQYEFIVRFSRGKFRGSSQ